MSGDRDLNLNKNQRLAVDIIGDNLIVNAGAGTGKTMVLVERFLEILDKGSLEKNREVESIVAITFTKKAAQEMITRIRKRLRENFSKGDKWKRFYQDIERANVSTIHSFCGNMLRENTVELGIDPKFQTLDENVSLELLKDSVGQVLLDYIGQDQVVYKMLKDLGLISLSGASETFLNLYNKLRNDGFKIDDLRSLMDSNLSRLGFDEEVLDEIRSGYIYLMENMSKSARVHKLKEDEKYLKFLNKSYEDQGELIEILTYMEGFINTSSKKFKAYADEVKNNINRLKLVGEVENKEYYFVILEVLTEIDRVYRDKKDEVAGLDYDDLQVYVNKLLDDPKHRAYYQNKYRYLMVDEFQDTNELQREIFYKLASREEKLDRKNLFIVGDPKQSIYGFRGGDLEVYYDTLEDIKALGPENLIELNENYRTNENIMEFINGLFEKLMDREYSSLRPNLKSDKNIEVEILNKEDLEIPAGESPIDYARLYESDLISKRILELVGSGEFEFGDIALLFRAKTRVGIYEESLRKYNIPYYNLGATGLFKSQEVMDLVNAFRALENPKDLLANIGFLRSPILGLSDEEIYLIMMEEGRIDQRLKLYASRDYVKDRELVDYVIGVYDHLLTRKRDLNNYEFLEELLEITRYKDLVLLLENGRQKYGNIEKLLTIFLDYENNGDYENYNIFSYIEELEKREIGQATVVSENENAVRILTIHKSKGLEFPVVILPELASGENNRLDSILYDKALGLGLNIHNRDGFYKLLKEKNRTKDEEENLRILYVAMTRAEKLLILGSQGKVQGFKKTLKGQFNTSLTKTIGEIPGDHKDQDLRGYIREDLKLEGEFYPKGLIEDEDYNKIVVDKFSISQFMKFKRCRREYYLDRFLNLANKLDVLAPKEEDLRLKLAGGSLSSLEKGNLVHKFCELYRTGLDSNLLLRKLVREAGYEEGLIRELEPYVTNYIKDYREDYDKIYREKEFNIEVAGGRFVGVIDRINILDGEIEIVDYKTNKVYNRQSIYDDYKDQIRFYAYILEGIFKRPATSGKLHLLEKGEFIEIDLDQEKIKNTVEEVEGFVNFVKNKDKMEDYDLSSKCSEYCRYYSICNKASL